MYRGIPNISNKLLVAIAYAVATIVVSCKGANQNVFDVNSMPRQTVEGMNAVQTINGILNMRMEAKTLQSFDFDTLSYELFPDGFDVYAYEKEGNLETQISSNIAKHTKEGKNEKWEAFGNVVINNFIKGERMETDTLYWNREEGKIFTHCFVKMFTPDGYMQGYGMESDDRGRNAKILRPFDSYAIITNDSTTVRYVDTVNFIGPVIN